MHASSKNTLLFTRPDSLYRKCVASIAAWAMLMSTMPTYGARAAYTPAATSRLLGSFFSAKEDSRFGNRYGNRHEPNFLIPPGATPKGKLSAPVSRSRIKWRGEGSPLQIASLGGGEHNATLRRALSPTTIDAGARAARLNAAIAPASPPSGGQVTLFGPQKYLRTTGAP